MDVTDSSISLTSGIVSESRSTVTATFSPLRTSHGGVYSCLTRFDIPEAALPDLNTSVSNTVVVQSKYFKVLSTISISYRGGGGGLVNVPLSRGLYKTLM